MKIIFTRSNKIGSKIIRWGLEEPVSHAAIVFSNGFVLHSHVRGIEPVWAKTFYEENEVVYTLKPKIKKNSEMELGILSEALNKFDNSKYDYSALVYFAWRVLLNKFTGAKFPNKNIWNRENQFLCTGWINLILYEVENDMITPMQLYNKLLESGKWKKDG